MEYKERFVLEIIAGVIFLAFLVLGSIVIINASEGTEITIKDSYNTYNINTEPVMASSGSYLKPYIVDRGDYARVYYIDDKSRVTTSDKRYLEYNSRSEYGRVKGIFGNYIDRYDVYVENEAYTGRYFKVTFNFEDYYGKIDEESMTYYIKPMEEKRFTFKDVTPSGYEHKRWWYEVKQ
jgi:hypothetical protein